MLNLFVPSVHSVDQVMTRANVQIALTITALAIEQYRLKKGDYPESLEELVPEFSDTPTKDEFNPGNPFNYRKTAEGYVLYSFGDNRIDDNGLSWDDRVNGRGKTDDTRILIGPIDIEVDEEE